MGKPPSAPNPSAVAQSATQGNMINQNSPWGSLTYSQNGTWSNGDPRYTSNVTLSPAQQQLLNTSQGTQQNLANTARTQSGRLNGMLSAPLDWSQQQGYLNDLTAGALDKTWAKSGQQFETDLVNRGIRPGSTAYQDAQSDFRTDRSNAYNSANVNNYNTALQSQLALRQAPLNEILALAGQGQIQSPQFQNMPQTDVAGIYQNGYANQMANYQSNQGLLGGLFSAGANLLPLLSDRRAKTDIKRIGTSDVGVPIYQYRYKSGGPVHIGYMAQDLLETHPDAVVVGPDGLYRVNYDKVA